MASGTVVSEDLEAEGRPAEIVADAQAFQQMVERYDCELRGLAFRLLGDRESVEDCLQEAYLRAFRSLPAFRGDAGIGTWLYRIVYNACIDELRRRRGQCLTLTGELPSSSADRAQWHAFTADYEADLEIALSKLPHDHRATLVLVDAEGWSYQEAAQLLGVAPGTVASRLSRARTMVRESMCAVA